MIIGILKTLLLALALAQHQEYRGSEGKSKMSQVTSGEQSQR